MKEPLESLLINKKENEAVIIGGMVLDIHATPSIYPAPRTTAPGKVHYAAGGVARNIAECVSKLGTKPFMISALGSDMSGNMLLEYWKSVGLSTQGIRMGHEIETPVVCIVFDTEGEPAAGVASVESLERYLTPQWIQQFKSNISSAPIVMVDANLSQPALDASCQLAAEVGTPVWFEPVSVAKSRRIVSVAKYVTFASPNEDEIIAMANALSDKDIFFPIQKDAIPVTSLFQQLKPAIWVLLEKGIKVVILTLGSKGVLLCSKHHLNFQNIGPNRTIKSHNIGQKLHEIINQVCPSDRFFSGLKESSRSSPFVVHFPAVLSSSVVRLTGAGDCLVGGSIASFCVGLDLMQSIAVGIAAAKATVEVEANVPTEYSLEQITGKTMLITALSDIDGTNGKCNIKVKVVSIWNQYYGITKQSKVAGIDMILMDEQGTKIHATIGNLVVSDFQFLIRQDDIHFISNFNVKSNTDMLKLTSHACKIHFLKKTNVRRCSDFADIQEPLNFLSFESFLGHKIDPKCSFDVIGQLVENNNITIIDPDDKPKHFLEFKLQDLSGVRVPCTLWNDLAVKLHDFIKANATSKDPIIMLIVMAKQIMWNCASQVSNCFAGTRMFINDESNPHIKEFKKK